MRLIGQTEVAAFLRDHPAGADVLRAWVAEMKYRDWDSPEVLTANFASVDVSRPPRAVFDFAAIGLSVETLIDFRNRVVLLVALQPRSELDVDLRQEGNTFRGH